MCICITSCHLLSFRRGLHIHVDFDALTKALRFIIFCLASIHFFVTTGLLIFGFLFFKKPYRVLSIVSYVLTSGFGKDVKSSLNNMA